MSDENRGIYEKYKVQRLNDPTGKHDQCNYFVLDLVHDEFALPALRAYAKACKKKYPQLAKDLRAAISFATGPKGEYFPCSLDALIAVKLERNK